MIRKRGKGLSFLLTLSLVLSLLAGTVIVPTEKTARAEDDPVKFSFFFVQYNDNGSEPKYETYDLFDIIEDNVSGKVYLQKDTEHTDYLSYKAFITMGDVPADSALIFDVGEWVNNKKVCLTMNGFEDVLTDAAQEPTARWLEDGYGVGGKDGWWRSTFSVYGGTAEERSKVQMVIDLKGNNSITNEGSHVFSFPGSLEIRKAAGTPTLTLSATNEQTDVIGEGEGAWTWRPYAIQLFGEDEASAETLNNRYFKVGEGVTLTTNVANGDQADRPAIELGLFNMEKIILDGTLNGGRISADGAMFRKGDTLCTKNNINDLSDAVGTALYQAPKDGNTYLGKAYYYSREIQYPNVGYSQIQDQNAGKWDTTTDWTFRGIYDKNGKPRGSHIYYQYYHLNRWGGVQTEDATCPVSYLVYDEYPEDKTKGAEKLEAYNDFPSVNGYVNSCKWTDLHNDGREVLSPNESFGDVRRIFNGDYYAVWGLNGNITINGNIINGLTLDRGYMSEEFPDGSPEKEAGFIPGIDHGFERGFVNEDGEFLSRTSIKPRVFTDVYLAKDSVGPPIDEETYKHATVAVNGDVGFIDLHDTFTGTCIITRGGLVGGMGYIHTDPKAYFPDMDPMDYYGSIIGDGDAIITDGRLRSDIKRYEEGEESGYYVYGASEESTAEDIGGFNGYTVVRGKSRGREEVAGTSSGVESYSDAGAGAIGQVDIDVSKSAGADVFPMIRRKETTGTGWKSGAAWWDAIKSSMKVTQATIMDIALVQENSRLVEPANKVNLYVNTDFTGSSMALYHVTDDGKIEKLASNGRDGYISASTGGFSTYFVAENTTVPTTVSAELKKLAKDQHDSDPPVKLGGGGGGGGTGGGGSGGSGGSGGGSGGSGTPAPSASPVPTASALPSAAPTVAPTVPPTVAPTVAPSAAPTPGASEPVTTTNPDGSVTTTVTTVDADGSTTTTAVTTDTDGNKTTETNKVGADGSTEKTVVTESKDGSSSRVTDRKKADGTTIHEEVTTTAKGQETSRIVETAPTGDSKITEQVKKPSGDYTKVTLKTTIKKDESGRITGATVTIDTVKKTGKLTLKASYVLLDVGKQAAGKVGLSYAEELLKMKKVKNAVAITKLTTSKKSGSVTIEKSVRADGKTYTVTTLKKGMLGGNKTKPKTVLIKATGITKVEKGAFNKLAGKATIQIKAGKKDFKRIKKLIKKSGVGKKVKFKRVK